MKKMITINQPRIFSLSDADGLLPLIYKITEDAHAAVKSLMNRMDSVKSTNPPLAADLGVEMDREIHRWEGKIARLGATPKGLWLADFDNGQGYYCWKYPETKIQFWHAYNEGFTGRKQIEHGQEYTENLL